MVIFVAHGSRDPKWRASIEAVVESLQAELGRDEVRLAYMDHSPLTLVTVASEAAHAGATSIHVAPLFLAEEGHVARDIRPTIGQLRAAFGQIEVELLPPMGQHPGFRALLHEIAAASIATIPR